MIKEYAQRPDSWRAKWIWHDNEIRKNTYAHFRRSPVEGGEAIAAEVGDRVAENMDTLITKAINND